MKEALEEKEITELEEICGNDKKTYEALSETMFLDPRKIVDISLEEAVKKAEDFKKSKDMVRAKVWYEIAGGLAIYEDNVAKVKLYFGKCQELSKSYKILEIPERAVEKAREYYQKHLKEEK